MDSGGRKDGRHALRKKTNGSREIRAKNCDQGWAEVSRTRCWSFDGLGVSTTAKGKLSTGRPVAVVCSVVEGGAISRKLNRLKDVEAEDGTDGGDRESEASRL